MTAISTSWIFAQYNPGVEYRSSPNNPDIVQRRKKASLTRYKLHFGNLPFSSVEGSIEAGNSIESYNGAIQRTLDADVNYICTEHILDQEGGQGSEMWKETQIWEAYSDWYDWTTIEDDLGTGNPFS